MNVLPVMDLLNRQVVHAVRGERSQYKPIESILTPSAEPVEVAVVLKAKGFSDLYVADLDAIIDCDSHDFSLLKEISQKTQLNLVVDAGVTSIERAKMLLNIGVQKIVVGTETLQNKNFVKEAVERLDAERIIVSLDLKEGKVLIPTDFQGPKDALVLLKEFKDMGIKKVIVLDLARVGSCKGVDVAFLEKVKALGLEVYAGGGVRNIWDLVKLNDTGISGALIATALHTGKISVAELKAGGFI